MSWDNLLILNRKKEYSKMFTICNRNITTILMIFISNNTQWNQCERIPCKFLFCFEWFQFHIYFLIRIKWKTERLTWKRIHFLPHFRSCFTPMNHRFSICTYLLCNEIKDRTHVQLDVGWIQGNELLQMSLVQFVHDLP